MDLDCKPVVHRSGSWRLAPLDPVQMVGSLHSQGESQTDPDPPYPDTNLPVTNRYGSDPYLHVIQLSVLNLGPQPLSP